ncbi:LuxR C-terminal-related transcriptional regulator [Tardiphaga sp. 20_F10_N6_6]|uniref:LuxR C-terminal-related transcriptional regulator n=1 Tax=Tardiphaga sp. 20_F10_N6_6 TaxID=3240788 RepID=UPI003F8BDF9B
MSTPKGDEGSRKNFYLHIDLGALSLCAYFLCAFIHRDLGHIVGRSDMISIALIDDHPLMVEAVSSLLLRTGGFEILATGGSANDVIEIGRTTRPQVMVVDLNMPGDVYAAITSTVTLEPSTKVIAFTAATGVEPAIRALDSGASGYVLKGSSARELIDAIMASVGGETYITQHFASRVIAALRDTSLRRRAAEAVKLSTREQQIVRLLLHGKTNKEIALTIHISEKTVKHYMTLLMQKLQVRNRLEVVIAAQKLDARSGTTALHS